MDNSSLIEFNNVTFSYDDGEPAVRGLTVTFNKGEFVTVLGRNGSGKSTLAKLTNALLVPNEGTVTVCGMSTEDEKNEFPIRQHVGMVFQNPDNQIVSTIVEDDVAFGPENLGVPPEEIRVRVDEALKAVGMYGYRGHEPHKLSGGQKQRVAIAGVLAMRTDCIVLDEPTAMLDPKGRREVCSALLELNRTYGITVIMITHFMNEAALAKRVLVMNSGNLVYDGTPYEVFSHSQELTDMGLAVPQSMKLALDLKARGIDLGEGILTPEDFVARYADYYTRSKNA